MKQPAEFPKAINVCTVIMSTLYAGLASAGYWSKGRNVADIVIFSLGESPLARVAAGCILIQVCGTFGMLCSSCTAWYRVWPAEVGDVQDCKLSCRGSTQMTMLRCRWRHCSRNLITFVPAAAVLTYSEERN
jgi:hypothetical protein